MHDCNAVLNPPATLSQSKKASTTELERLSTIIPTVVNTRDFDFKSTEAQELLSHVSSGFLSQIETLPSKEKTISWAGQVAAWKHRATEHPDVYFAVTSVSSTVDERTGFAQVYVEMEVSGIGDVKLHAMNELLWRKVLDEWLLYFVIGMRGTPGNSGLG